MTCNFGAERSRDMSSRFHNSNKVLGNVSDSTGEDIPRPANAAVICCFCSIVEEDATLQLEAREKIKTQLFPPKFTHGPRGATSLGSGWPPSPRQQGRDGENSRLVRAGNLVGSEGVRNSAFWFFLPCCSPKKHVPGDKPFRHSISKHSVSLPEY